MPADEVLIIGAGPFGLSIAAHLRAAGIAHRIVGRPMGTWKAHCPPGMMLRSEPYGSDMAAPQPGWDVRAYCQKHGLDYQHRLGPLSIERFLDYADWYTRELVPDVSDLTVTGITPAGGSGNGAGGFRVTFADANPVTARQVVVATGVLPYAVLPPELDGLPSELVSHTCDHHLLSAFAGRRVAVVGGGQSALETAALLHEAGAEVQVVMRRAGAQVAGAEPGAHPRAGLREAPVQQALRGLALRVLELTVPVPPAAAGDAHRQGPQRARPGRGLVAEAASGRRDRRTGRASPEARRAHRKGRNPLS